MKGNGQGCMYYKQTTNTCPTYLLHPSILLQRLRSLDRRRPRCEVRVLSERFEERLELHVGPDGICGPVCGDSAELGGECGAGGGHGVEEVVVI